MTVRIDEMTHMPATTEASGSGAAASPAGAQQLTAPQILALVRREAERRERLGAD